MKHKFQTTFSSKLHVVRENKSLFKLESKAAQEDLLKDIRNLLPNQEEIDASKDLVFVAGNAAAINLINLNGAGMKIDTCLAMQASVKNKYINLNHDRSQCVGFITGSYFSTFGDNKVITAEEAAKIKGPVNLVVTGIIWRTVGYAADMVEWFDNASQSQEDFHELSISWEVGFNEYEIVKGSKNIFKGEIIEDEKEIEKLSPFLQSEGGDGFDTLGNELYMVIKGSPTFLGIGLTTSPASAVQGLVSTPNKVLAEKEGQDSLKIVEHKDVTLEEIEEKTLEVVLETQNNAKKVEKSENNISQTKNNSVIKPKFMKFKTKDELFAHLDESSVSPLTQRALDNYLIEEIAQEAKKYSEQITAAQNEANVNKLAADEFKLKAEKASEEIASLTSKLNDLETRLAEDHAQNVLDSRMFELSEKYNLEQKTKAYIVKQIKGLSDEEFASWKDEAGEVFLSGREKVEKVDIDAATKALKETEASTSIPNAQEIKKDKDYSSLYSAIEIK